ncbi:hypothetical protein NLJ89_g713 [Agrocybe chaxingu]|uniref:RING-type domain-containing protein n=1 Tax=Agrocybe chaxingu TaxID=84603 RepID=A0A9W8TEG5_9AGAR|nr:hypothetical protein NLJ89_g713 [Agrocybe chaxingu]
MLSLGAGSSCDICFEIFGQDLKAPCSIACGHVFCIECIAQLTTRLCPLCRSEFDEDSCIRLHIDMDNTPTPSDPTSGKCSLDDIAKARRFAEAYASITDQGTTESRLRQVILDGRQFLASQPKHLFRDLRVTHRLIAYLCEVKATLRTQNHAVETLNEQIKQLTTEKEGLTNQLAELESLRNYEKETALAVETSLRSHCDNAVKLYHGMIEMFNKVVTQNAELLSQSAAASTSASTPLTDPPASSIFNILPPVDAQALKGIAIQDPKSSFLISPLPQFTGALPSILDGFTPLPELTEDAEEEDEKSDEEDEVSTPDSAQHQRSFQAVQETKPSPSARSSADTLPPLRSEMSLPEPSGLSRSAPYLDHRRARSRSNPSPIASCSHSPSSSNSTPPMSSPQHLSSYQPSSSRYISGSSSHDARSSSPRGGVQAQDGEVLRTRLYDILRATPTSTSLPTMPSSHFPASLTNRDRGAEPSSPPHRQRSREREGRGSPPSRAGPSSASRVAGPSSSTDSVSHLLASHPQQTPHKPPSSTSPNPLAGLRYTTASAEAKKLEEERRKKIKEEKYALEQERQAAEAAEREREAYRPKVSSTSASTSASQAARWDATSNTYSTPVPPSNAGASFPGSTSLKRGSSTNNGLYGRSTSGFPPPQPPPEYASAQQPRYSGSSNSKSRPTVLPSNPAGIYT